MDNEFSVLETVRRRFDNYSTTRRNSIETRWLRNSQAYRFDKTDIWASGWKENEGKDWRSNTFVNITHQKCLAAYALISDMILENGKVPFTLDAGDERIEEQFAPQLKMIHDEMERAIRDTNVDREISRNILAMTIFGESYAKFGVRSQRKTMMEEDPQTGEAFPVQVDEPLPEWIFVPVWDLFFDMSFDKLEDSPGVFHRMYLGKSELLGKVGRPFFIDDQIKALTRERNEDEHNRNKGEADESPRFTEITKGGAFPVYEYWGTVPRVEAESFESSIDYQVEQVADGGGDGDDELKEAGADDGDDVEVMLWYANDRVVRYTRVEKKDRPFVRCCFEDPIDSNWGIGVADNISDVQLVLNGAVRGYEDNKKLSGNVMIATKDRFFETDDTALSPGKVFHLTEDCQDARQAIQPITVPDVGNGLLDVISLFNDRFADEFSQLPKVSQGISAKKNITAYEVSQQVENAGKYIGAVVRNIDEFLLEPMFEKFYEVISAGIDMGVPSDMFRVKTLGYKTFQNKIVRVQKLQQLMGMAAEPQIGQFIKMRELVRNVAQSYDIDHERFIKTDEEMEAEQAEQAEQQQIEMQGIQLQLEKVQAEIQLMQARAMDAEASANVKGGKLAIDQARLVSDIEREAKGEVAGMMGYGREPRV